AGQEVQWWPGRRRQDARPDHQEADRRLFQGRGLRLRGAVPDVPAVGGLLPPLLGVESGRGRSRLFVAVELDWTSMPRLAATAYWYDEAALFELWFGRMQPWPRNPMSETPSNGDGIASRRRGTPSDRPPTRWTAPGRRTIWRRRSSARSASPISGTPWPKARGISRPAGRTSSSSASSIPSPA